MIHISMPGVQMPEALPLHGDDPDPVEPDEG